MNVQRINSKKGGEEIIRHIRSATAVFVLVTALLALLVIARHRSAPSVAHSSPRALATAPVELVRLSPPGDASTEVDCQSLAFVEFTYQVYNRGPVPIKGLKLGTKCGCEEAGPLPEELLPGQSAPIRFRLRSPYVGKAQRKVPLLFEGAAEPAAVIDVSMRVKFEPPRLLPLPDGRSLSFMSESRAPRELMFEAIEANGQKPWITGLTLDLEERLEVRALETEGFREEDPGLVRRRYRVAIANRSLSPGQHLAVASFRTREGSPPLRDPVAIWINVSDSIAVVPSPLVINYAIGSPPPSRRVRVMDRIHGKAIVKAIEYDHDRLRVEAAGGKSGATAAFEVMPLQTPDSPAETRVVFHLGDDETRTLMVRFEPSEQTK